MFADFDNAMYILLTVLKKGVTYPIIEKLITPIKNFSEVNTTEKLIHSLVQLQIKEHNHKISHPPQPGKFILPTIHYLPYLLDTDHSIVMNEHSLLTEEEIFPLVQQAFDRQSFTIELPESLNSWTQTIALTEGHPVCIIKNPAD